MIYLQNFKGFAQTEVDLQQPVTLLIGPNGSGKSNLIEALELLSFMVSGQPLHRISDTGWILFLWDWTRPSVSAEYPTKPSYVEEAAFLG
jgi:energy-coupling factor transporter ATP-binding protein EcfA2